MLDGLPVAEPQEVDVLVRDLRPVGGMPIRSPVWRP